MKNETTTAASWMANFPEPSEEQKKEAHVRFLECYAEELRGIWDKMYHEAQLTPAEKNTVLLVIEDVHRKVENEVFAARGGEIVP